MPKIKKKPIKQGKKIVVRDSTPVEEAMDKLLKACLSNSAVRKVTPVEDWTLEDLQDWEATVKELAENLQYQIRLEQVGATCIRR